MELVAVRCQNCGASLKLEPDTRFVTCKHCDSQLEVRQTGDAAFTRVLEEVEDRLDNTEREIARLRFMHQLERLDREWEQEKESFASYSKHGAKTYPSPFNSIIVVVIGLIVIGFILTNESWQGVSQGLVLLVALVGIPAIAMHAHFKYRAFSEAEARYRKNRLALLAELGRVQGNPAPETKAKPRFPLVKEKRQDPLA